MSELIHLLDGVVVLYRRDRSARWQARLKLADGSWRRVSTSERDKMAAGKAAMKLYYDAEFKRENKLPQNTRRFGAVADAVAKSLQTERDAGKGKSVYGSYISAITVYLKPFFGKHNIDSITPDLLNRFDVWRVKQMGKEPTASTITNHNSALNRVFDYALERGWTTRTALPKLANKGTKGTTRPAFTIEEYRSLVRKLPAWVNTARMEKSRHMRELLRDYVLILANTGMRHGTEALKLKWQDIDWITKDKKHYLRITVDGKTGNRQLIARANTMDFLKRIQARFADLNAVDFDVLLKKRFDSYVFRLPNGTQTNSLNQTCIRPSNNTHPLFAAPG